MRAVDGVFRRTTCMQLPFRRGRGQQHGGIMKVIVDPPIHRYRVVHTSSHISFDWEYPSLLATRSFEGDRDIAVRLKTALL